MRYIKADLDIAIRRVFTLLGLFAAVVACSVSWYVLMQNTEDSVAQATASEEKLISALLPLRLQGVVSTLFELEAKDSYTDSDMEKIRGVSGFDNVYVVDINSAQIVASARYAPAIHHTAVRILAQENEHSGITVRAVNLSGQAHVLAIYKIQSTSGSLYAVGELGTLALKRLFSPGPNISISQIYGEPIPYIETPDRPSELEMLLRHARVVTCWEHTDGVVLKLCAEVDVYPSIARLYTTLGILAVLCVLFLIVSNWVAGWLANDIGKPIVVLIDQLRAASVSGQTLPAVLETDPRVGFLAVMFNTMLMEVREFKRDLSRQVALQSRARGMLEAVLDNLQDEAVVVIKDSAVVYASRRVLSILTTAGVPKRAAPHIPGFLESGGSHMLVMLKQTLGDPYVSESVEIGDRTLYKAHTAVGEDDDTQHVLVIRDVTSQKDKDETMDVYLEALRVSAMNVHLSSANSNKHALRLVGQSATGGSP